MANTKTKEIWAPCNECERETLHVVLKSDSIMQTDEEYGAWWETTYRMIKCAGCRSVSLERSIASSEYEEPEKEYFPPVISRRRPNWASNHGKEVGPNGLVSLLNEVYLALHADSRRLATMGARTILDMVMTDKVGDIGGFGVKLNALQMNGLIAQTQREFLDAALEAGNASAHRGHIPNSENLDYVMDILENLIAQVYVLPEAARSLRQATPKRKK